MTFANYIPLEMSELVDFIESDGVVEDKDGIEYNLEIRITRNGYGVFISNREVSANELLSEYSTTDGKPMGKYVKPLDN